MPDWDDFQKTCLRYPDCGITIDFSRMGVPEGFFEQHSAAVESAFADMRELEAGGVANPDEGRMVGHYWLRDASLAPSSELREEIDSGIADAKGLAARVHGGELAAPNGARFRHLLLIGIGGSALGPQLVADCLGGPDSPMTLHFFDNTDPDGFDRVLAGIGESLAETLGLVVSKSGGTKETRNGMMEAEAAFGRAGLDFSKYAVAVTGIGSQLDHYATEHGWLERFPMAERMLSAARELPGEDLSAEARVTLIMSTGLGMLLFGPFLKAATLQSDQHWESTRRQILTVLTRGV